MSEDKEPISDIFNRGWPEEGYEVVKIRLNPIGKGRIWIDGVELKSTASIEVKATANEFTTIVVTLIAINADIEAIVHKDALAIKDEDE